MRKEARQPAARTYVENAAEHALDAAYRRRHLRLDGAGHFVRLVEEGGMGAVLEVRGAGGKPLALKLIKEKLVGDATAAARFRRELASHRRLTASFQVPRLVPCLGFSDDDDPGRVYGLFPLYADGTLEDRLAFEPPRSEALWILADALEGLQSLHGLRYVHRDFHPANVLVEREGGRRRGVLGDLGVGLFLSSNTIFSETQLDADRSRRMGHPGYIDPGYRASPEADLYAVGATLYRVLAGRTPAGGNFPESEPLPLPREVELPGGLEIRSAARRLLVRLTTPAKDGRYPSAREARDDVVRLAELLEDAERSRPPARRVVVRVGGPSRRTGRRAALAAVVAGTVACSGYGLWAMRDPLPRPLSQPISPEVRAVGIPEAADPLPRPLSHPPLMPARKRGAPALPEDTPSPESRPEPLSLSEQEVSEVAALDALLRDREYRRAEALARALWERRPGNPDVAGRLALLRTRNDPEAGWSEARAVLTAALLRHPARGDLRLALARVSMTQGLAGSALGWLRDAPPGSTHRDEIETLRVTLERARDREQPP